MGRVGTQEPPSPEPPVKSIPKKDTVTVTFHCSCGRGRAFPQGEVALLVKHHGPKCICGKQMYLPKYDDDEE